jgi:hypothetical protein
MTTRLINRHKRSIFRVTGCVLFATLLFYLGLQGWTPAYMLWFAIMNVSLPLYILIGVATGYLAELFEWIPSEHATLIINGAIIVSLEILQGALMEGAWQLIRRKRKRQPLGLPLS